MPKINEALIAANLKKVFSELEDIKENLLEPNPGPQGFKGDRGSQGPQGNIGKQGPAGSIGMLGEQGPPGPVGPIGSSGPQGIQGERGDKGETGDVTIVTGPTGAQGDTGPQGETGPEGPQGSSGERGPRGVIGDRGPQGIQGPRGIKGDVGEKGDAGVQGQQGVPGNQGPQGTTGLQGASGDPGPKGEDGSQGPRGEVGPEGAQGLQGLPGTPAPKVDTQAITAPVIEEFSNQHRNHIREIQKALSLGGGGLSAPDTIKLINEHGGTGYTDSDVNSFMSSGSSTGITTAGDLTVNGIIYADSINFTSTGSTTFNSGNEFVLSAVDRVKVPSSPFQVAQMTDSERSSISLAENGDMIYNKTSNKFQGYANGSWVDLH